MTDYTIEQRAQFTAMQIVLEDPSARALLVNGDGYYAIFSTDGGDRLVAHLATVIADDQQVKVTRFDTPETIEWTIKDRGGATTLWSVSWNGYAAGKRTGNVWTDKETAEQVFIEKYRAGLKPKAARLLVDYLNF